MYSLQEKNTLSFLLNWIPKSSCVSLYFQKGFIGKIPYAPPAQARDVHFMVTCNVAFVYNVMAYKLTYLLNMKTKYSLIIAGIMLCTIACKKDVNGSLS